MATDLQASGRNGQLLQKGRGASLLKAGLKGDKMLRIKSNQDFVPPRIQRQLETTGDSALRGVSKISMTLGGSQQDLGNSLNNPKGLNPIEVKRLVRPPDGNQISIYNELDISQHYIPIEDLKRNLFLKDASPAANVLRNRMLANPQIHIHAQETQNDKASPKLHLNRKLQKSRTTRVKDIQERERSPNKLVIQQNAPSIPYKDSTFGYEPLDESGKFLINVGNSFKESYQKEFDQTPGPGAYEIAKSYLVQAKNKSKVLRYDKDTSRRSDLENKQQSSRIGPGSYNTDRQVKTLGSYKAGTGSRSSNVSLLGHSAFATGPDPTSQNLFSRQLADPLKQVKNLQNSNEFDPIQENIELFSQREAVSGKYIKTKKINKLSNYYMDILMKQKLQEAEYRTERAVSEQKLLSGYNSIQQILPSHRMDHELSKVPSLAQIAQRHQSFESFAANMQKQQAAVNQYKDEHTSIDGATRERQQNALGNRDSSPGPGSYLDIYENSAFKQKVDPRSQEIINKKQEFGSQRPRFEGPESARQEVTQHLGPGCYQIRTHTQLNKIKRQSKESVGFGHSPRKDERYEYVHQDPANRMMSPGLYTYEDERRTKKSHRKGENQILVNQEKRFSNVMDFTVRGRDAPGPGQYLGKDSIDMKQYSGMLLLQTNTLQDDSYQNVDSIPNLPKIVSQGQGSIQAVSGKISVTKGGANNYAGGGSNSTMHQRQKPLHLKKNMSSILDNVDKRYILSNKVILDTKRGKNNPSAIFVEPKYTRDPSKRKLERVYQESPMPNSQVAVGTYDNHRINTIGRRDVDDKFQEIHKQSIGKPFSMLKIEDKNRKWIDRARIDYMSKLDGKDRPDLESYLKAHGFDDE